MTTNVLLNTEEIYAALFAKFAGLTSLQTPFVTVTRRLKHFADLDLPKVTPYMAMQEGHQQTDIVRRGVPSIWTLPVKFWLYFTQANEVDPVMPVVNTMMDSVRACLAPDDPSANELTLGGLVSHCRVHGTTEIYEGINDGTLTVVILPVEIKLAA